MAYPEPESDFDLNKNGYPCPRMCGRPSRLSGGG